MHITGGGFYENIPRALPEGMSAKIYKDELEIPGIFKLLMKEGNIPERDMFNTYNMGTGMTVVVPKEDAARAVEIIEAAGEHAKVIGEIVKELSLNKQKARIAVLVSGGGTNLQAIINRWQAGDLPHGDLALVVSNRSKAGGLQRAEKAGIRNVFLPKEDFEARLIQLLEEERIDIIVLAGFLKILSRDFVRRYPDRILNVHPSLIPSFCGDGFYGLKVHEAALEYGVKVSGATVHFVNEVTDGGRIIAQKAVEVKPDDTPETLQRRIMEQAEWILLPEAVETVAREIVEHESEGE